MMERYGMTQAAAFNYLLRQSSTENRKLRLVASEVVSAVEDATHGTRPRPM
jgi:AmiR/NasT family two-component response regulator